MPCNSEYSEPNHAAFVSNQIFWSQEEKPFSHPDYIHQAFKPSSDNQAPGITWILLFLSKGHM